MTKQDIISFYKKYEDQVLSEMKEHLDKPLDFIDKISNTEYVAYDLNNEYVKVKFIFRPVYPGNIPNVNMGLAKKNHEITWYWDKSMTEDNKTPQNFLRVLATSLSVLHQFIEENNPDIVVFSGMSKGHDNVYFGDTFQKRLKTLVGDEYDIMLDKPNSITFIVNKVVSTLKQEAINKRAKTTSITESVIYWRYSHLHPGTPNNVKLKNIIKQKVIKQLYNI